MGSVQLKAEGDFVGSMEKLAVVSMYVARAFEGLQEVSAEKGAMDSMLARDFRGL